MAIAPAGHHPVHHRNHRQHLVVGLLCIHLSNGWMRDVEQELCQSRAHRVLFRLRRIPPSASHPPQCWTRSNLRDAAQPEPVGATALPSSGRNKRTVEHRNAPAESVAETASQAATSSVKSAGPSDNQPLPGEANLL